MMKPVSIAQLSLFLLVAVGSIVAGCLSSRQDLADMPSAPTPFNLAPAINTPALLPTVTIEPSPTNTAAPANTPELTPTELSGGPDCLIKGNVNSKGDRIYHVPGWRDYERTNVKPEEGDRWFCTEDEAMAAGFRAPLNR
jgi:hypothetical protein